MSTSVEYLRSHGVIELVSELLKLEEVMSTEIDSSSSSDPEMLQQLLEQKKACGMVALKGFSSTCKTELALRIGKWGYCPVLCIQDFLGDGQEFDHFNFSYADLSPPNRTDQVEIHHQKAFSALMNVAQRHLGYKASNCVIIKSNIDTAYEIEKLVNCSKNLAPAFILVIIECKLRNKYLWKNRFVAQTQNIRQRRWTSPRSWKDIEKVLDDYAAQSPSEDLLYLHYHRVSVLDPLHMFFCNNSSIFSGCYGPHDPTIIWLQVDPFYDLFLGDSWQGFKRLPHEFTDAIEYLLTVHKQVKLDPNVYVVEYDELRRFLFDKKLRAAASKGRTQSFCQGDCVFKYWPDALEDCEDNCCGVCQGKIYGQAYTCHFCIASLHRTCAERIDVGDLESRGPKGVESSFFDSIFKKRPCRACEKFSEECKSCLFVDRLKCQWGPTIINHSSHDHFLSIQIFTVHSVCKACGIECREIFVNAYYGCKRCAFYCHPRCAFSPLELKHEHGGHEHVMKLTYSRDGMDEEEDCWCDFCYQDLDPQVWFYYCQECPHYVVHLKCADGYRKSFYHPHMVKFVEQIQSQLQDWLDAGNVPACNEWEKEM